MWSWREENELKQTQRLGDQPVGILMKRCLHESSKRLDYWTLKVTSNTAYSVGRKATSWSQLLLTQSLWSSWHREASHKYWLTEGMNNRTSETQMKHVPSSKIKQKGNGLFLHWCSPNSLIVHDNLSSFKIREKELCHNFTFWLGNWLWITPKGVIKFPRYMCANTTECKWSSEVKGWLWWWTICPETRQCRGAGNQFRRWACLFSHSSERVH